LTLQELEMKRLFFTLKTKEGDGELELLCGVVASNHVDAFLLGEFALIDGHADDSDVFDRIDELVPWEDLDRERKFVRLECWRRLYSLHPRMFEHIFKADPLCGIFLEDLIHQILCL